MRIVVCGINEIKGWRRFEAWLKESEWLEAEASKRRLEEERVADTARWRWTVA